MGVILHDDISEAKNLQLRPAVTLSPLTEAEATAICQGDRQTLEKAIQDGKATSQGYMFVITEQSEQYAFNAGGNVGLGMNLTFGTRLKQGRLTQKRAWDFERLEKYLRELSEDDREMVDRLMRYAHTQEQPTYDTLFQIAAAIKEPGMDATEIMAYLENNCVETTFNIHYYEWI